MPEGDLPEREGYRLARREFRGVGWVHQDMRRLEELGQFGSWIGEAPVKERIGPQKVTEFVVHLRHTNAGRLTVDRGQ